MGIFTECSQCVLLKAEIKERDAEIKRLTRCIELCEENNERLGAEIERLRYDLGLERHSNERLRQETLVQSEAIETLRLESSQWQSACAGYTEALAARDRDNAALLEELARIRDQIAKHNISIKEAIRRGEAFEWKTLTLDS